MLLALGACQGRAAPPGAAAPAMGGKVCSVIDYGNWRDSLPVPGAFPADGCKAYMVSSAARMYELGCFTTSGVAFGPSGTANVDAKPPNPDCGWLTSAGPPRPASPSPPTPIVDCFWSLEAQAWVDTNGDGLRDKREGPLPGVRFQLNESPNVESDSHGVGKLFIFPANCSGMEMAVSALPPPGYEPSTDQPLKVRGAGDVGKASFGFRHVH